MIISILSAVLAIIGIVWIMRLTPDQVTADLLDLITPRDSLREQARNMREGRAKHRIFRLISNVKGAMVMAGRERQFSLVCTAAIVLCALGIVLAVLINNIWMMPALVGVGVLVPFIAISGIYNKYRTKEKEELETAMSIISTSYIRSNDIIRSVAENLPYIKPPLKDVFQAFVVEATTITSDVGYAIANLRSKIDDTVYREWCTTLLQCQDDNTQRDTLLATVDKLADVRTVNGELQTMIANARNEYWIMVLLVILNIPILYFTNRDWLDILLFSTPGKITCGVVSLVILVTTVLMLRFTRPLEYKR